LGARETTLWGGKGKLTSLPTSSLTFRVAEWETDVPRKMTRDNNKSDLMK